MLGRYLAAISTFLVQTLLRIIDSGYMVMAGGAATDDAGWAMLLRVPRPAMAGQVLAEARLFGLDFFCGMVGVDGKEEVVGADG